VGKLLLQLLPLRKAAAAAAADLQTRCQAAMLLHMFEQSKQQLLVSWLRSWLPHLLSTVPTEVSEFAMLAIQRFQARNAGTSSSGNCDGSGGSSSSDLWQQAADLVCRVPTAISAANPHQVEVILGPASKFFIDNSMLERHTQQQCAAHTFFSLLLLAAAWLQLLLAI
jgi:hypothetical protein